MKPYKFEPILKTTIWGGYQIAPFKGIYTAQPNIGESWEISGVPGHESVAIERGLVDDVDVGLSLTQLIEKYKGLLLGEKVYKKFGNNFPLLIKFIDSRQDLSVQVHPDDKLAKERHGCNGKTEMWYVIKSDIGAKIYAGLKKSITPEEYEQRELHIEEAKAAIDYQVWPEYRTSYDSTKPTSQLINCPYFNVNRVVVQVAAQIDFKVDSFVVVVCLWGEANINGIKVRQGETLLVPACENILYIFGNATFLTATM